MINFRLIPILLSPFFLIGIYYLIGTPENNIFLITNLLILLVSFCGMFFYPLRFYTLSKIVFLYIFIFFGITPLLNEIDNNVLYGGEFDIFDKILANLIILLGISFFIIGSYIRVNFFDRFVDFLPEPKKLNFFYYIIFFIVSFLILKQWNLDLNSLLVRAMDNANVGDNFISVDTNFAPRLDFHLYTKFIRPMPIILLVIFVYFYKKNKQFFNYKQKLNNFILLLLLAIFSIFLNFPTSIDRSQAAILYIPLVIIFTRIWEKPFMFQLSMLGGIFILFPFLDKFRKFNTETFNFRLSPDYLQTGHFDSYQNFVRVIEIEFISYGIQLLGTLFFFIPRSFWSEKAIGSGSALAIEMDYRFAGISMPFIGEGYVNFGIIGSCLFMFFLGILLSNLDRIAWKLKNLNQDCLFLYYYYFLFGMVFFSMRGDLINSMAFLTGITASFWVLVIILKLTTRFKYLKN